MKQIVLLLLVITASLNAQQESPSAPILFIYDASGSMWGQLHGQTKMEIAADVLSSTIQSLGEQQEIGLVAYGHRNKSDCTDVETLVGIDNQSKATVVSAIQTIKPLGKTPLAYSAQTVIDQLRSSGKQATIILITDGIESCNGDICQVVKTARKEGVDFKLHIVGFGLKESETAQLKCAAAAGDGSYYDAADAGALSEVMNEAVAQTIDKKEGNFGVYAVKNGAPIDAYVNAYKAGTDEKVGALRTYGETRYMYLPEGTYDLVAYPMGSSVEAITITGEKSFENEKTERTISFDGGIVAINTTNNGENWDATVSIVNKDGKRVGGGRTYTRIKEIEVNPGVYDIHLQALQIKGMHTKKVLEDVVVKSGETTPVNYDFATGNFNVHVKVNGEHIDTMVQVRDIDADKHVVGGRTYSRGVEFIMNPGNYEVTITPLSVYKHLPKKKFTYSLKQGETHTETITYD